MKTKLGNFGKHLGILLLCCFHGSVSAFEIEEIKDEELSPVEKAWLEGDTSNNTTAMVNEGQLTYIDPALTTGKYALFNQLRFLEDSLFNQTIEFTQCHKNLDAIRAIDIVYNQDTISDLAVTSSKKIQKIQVGKDRVELYQVHKGAEICVQGLSKTLSYNTNLNVWELERGPYMRKFLDGYYPMHLQEKIDFGNSKLSLHNIQIHNAPLLQPKQSLKTNKSTNTVTLNYYFEGRLKPIYQFVSND